jgi:hypothetical protein
VREFHPLPFSFRLVAKPAGNRPLVDFLKSKQLLTAAKVGLAGLPGGIFAQAGQLLPRPQWLLA